MSDDGIRGCAWAYSAAVIALGFVAVSLWSDVALGRELSTGTCPAEPFSGSALTLAQATDLALCRNAEIQSAAAVVRIRAAQVGQARAQYWPTLSASATELRESTHYPGSASPSTTDTAGTLYGALVWKLFDFGGRRADVRAASELLEAAFASQDATIQRVLGMVVQAYFDAVTAKALLDSKAEDESLASRTLASSEHRLQRGDAAQSDALQAKSALARAKLESNRARAAYDKSLAVLAYAIGLPAGTSLPVSDDREPLATADIEQALTGWLDEARRNHPAIVAARAEVEAARARVSAVRSSGLPWIDLQANYYANGFPQEGLATMRQRSVTVGLGITIPLFDGFLTRYKRDEAHASVSLKETALLDTERLTLTEIIKAYTDATSAIGNLRASQELLEAALASHSSSQRRYDSGIADILELLSAQGALAEARQERIRSVADWRSARLRLLATSGLLTRDDFKPD